MKRTIQIIVLTTIILLAIKLTVAVPPYLNNQQTIELYKNYQQNTIGQSLLEQNINAIQITPKITKTLIIVRQHGSEYYTNYIALGILKETNKYPACEITMIINSNPDGINNKTRVNSQGQDLNRLWNKPIGEAQEIDTIKNYITGKKYDKFIDLHGYNGAETTNEILTTNTKSTEYCNKNPVITYKCHNIIDWQLQGTADQYNQQQGIPLTFSIETQQQNWKNATQTQLENQGRILTKFICQ